MINGKQWSEQIRYYLPTIFVAVMVLVMWETAVRVLGVQQFLLPKPSSIATSLVSEWAIIKPRILFTGMNAVGGFLIGSTLGVMVALFTARFVTLTEAMMPFAISANSVPIIAMAPIMFNWFGPLNPLSWMMIVAMMVFFPVMINTVRGLTEVDNQALELMHSYAAPESKVLSALRIPNALPFIFSALRVASVLSMIGSIVADFFGAERNSLGKYVTQEAAVLRFSNTWSAVVVASLMGLIFYGIIVLAERYSMPWVRATKE